MNSRKNGVATIKTVGFLFFLLGIVAIASISTVSADTYVNGTISEDTTWDLAGSPYIVDGNVYVKGTDGPDSVTTLTIEPGVVVMFNPYIRLEIGSDSASEPGALIADGTPDNKIIFTNASTTRWDMIYFHRYSNDTMCILDNTVVEYGGHYGYGNIYCYYASPTITNSEISNGSSYGIYTYYCSSPMLTNNNITQNTHGIYIRKGEKHVVNDSMIYNNSDYGIYLHSSSNNLIYNNYFNNTNNAWDNGNNIWNITKTNGTNIIGGPYLGGNYWSDYTGIDENGDGLGEAPYNITGGSNKDYLPLVQIFLPDLLITHKWVCWPDNCTICYNVTNIGNGTVTAGHNTTLFVDGVEKAQDSVLADLAPNESYIGCFNYIWTYTPPSDNITVCADSNNTIEESNETNNCAINTWMCGDVNEDGTVNVLDVLEVYRRALDPETIRLSYHGLPTLTVTTI